ncbi:MAG: Chemotaxis regulator - transmits chemoreceptor signals to flagelllar motor components CheY [uncultured Chthoniobacterales bacterium]|uniref:histidine kinase n=1 Tax=uncultured Chthoniobacterales bacterium TaxID=1836801 RepID=A0A6J4I9M4_9BACT|nr:MAG: Chemotaxis regulator - transmits chemoreceptor signals to flagelllar motor components CheY [uncultured Chthoniobacterales bacterium]
MEQTSLTNEHERQFPRVLVIDDEPANVLLAKRILTKAGYDSIGSTTDPREAAKLFAETGPDIVLLDLQMPHLSGFDVMEQLRSLTEPGEFLPIIVLTADITPQTKLRALSGGATDFLTKPFDHAEVLQRVQNLWRTRQLHLELVAYRRDLEQLVGERTADLRDALRKLEETQKHVIEQERLHAFGTMASGVTHDFNNALSVILGFSEIALQELDDPDTHPVAPHLRTIMTAALDGAAMVNRLRDFYRPGGREEPRAVIDLNALVEQAAGITKPKWSSQARAKSIEIELRTKLNKVPPISGDAAELREALTNLIFNAVDAMPDGGEITLRTVEELADVRLEISDTGTGMPEEVRRRCLEPFFTTKGELGTGLGLAMVYGTIERHGGKMEIESEPGRGTTFLIRLPKHLATSQVKAQSEAHAVQPLSILVVDDQPVLCEIVAAYLMKDSHVVEVAQSGEEALAKFEPGAFDLVITDHVMAGMSGLELAARIKEQSPLTPVFLLTGYADTQSDTAPTAEHEGIDQVLGKPISQIDLRKAITRISSDEGEVARAPVA